MAPLAGMLAERGHRVTGSDTGVYPPASTLLQGLGIRWTNGFSEANLDPAPDIVVLGNALSRGNPEVECVLIAKSPIVRFRKRLKIISPRTRFSCHHGNARKDPRQPPSGMDSGGRWPPP